MLVRSPSVLPEIEDMGITSPSRSFMQQRPSFRQKLRMCTETRISNRGTAPMLRIYVSTYTVAMIYATTPRPSSGVLSRVFELTYKCAC
ncbi:MAG: hypothetical protein VB125_04785 [Burkholderia sp.]